MSSRTITMSRRLTTQRAVMIICGKYPIVSVNKMLISETDYFRMPNEVFDRYTYRSEHLSVRYNRISNKSDKSITLRNVPSNPGASGILFLNCGSATRIAPADTRYFRMRFASAIRRARITCPTATCVSTQLTPKRSNVIPRASVGLWTRMSKSRVGSSSIWLASDVPLLSVLPS